MLFIAKIKIYLRPTILDVQGTTVTESLHHLGFQSIKKTRVGKYIELDIEADSKEKAYELAKTSCEKLLANPIMEDVDILIEKK